MLGAYGETDRCLGDALIGQLLIGELGVGGGSGVDNQGLHIRYVCQQGEDLQIIYEAVSLSLTALDLKGEDGSASVGEILGIEGVIGMIGERGVIYLGYLRVLRCPGAARMRQRARW